MKKDVAALALSETFKGWMADKEEAIAVREEKKCRKKETTCNVFYDLTKTAIEVEESMSKAKLIEVEAKLMAEEREIMFVETTNMSEGQKAWVEKHPTMRRMIEFDLCVIASNLCLIMKFVSFCLNLFIGSAQC
jgi:hypothetical protein